MTARDAVREKCRKPTLYLVSAIAILLLIRVFLLGSLPADASETRDTRFAVDSPAPVPTPDQIERLAEPPKSNPPTQVELGHHAYWFSCMVCHGDRGQGLTDEWRNVNPPEDRDCWQSRCHAPNHPPEGFEIPRTAPAVMGPGALSSFETAADLYAYTAETMPWAFPGERSEDEYWQLTAFLADANQVVLSDELIGPDSSATVYMKLRHAPGWQPSAGTERIGVLLVLALLLTALLVYRWIHFT